jgi:ABC-type nickel/cobalt efflux system permease component RcnA
MLSLRAKRSNLLLYKITFSKRCYSNQAEIASPLSLLAMTRKNAMKNIRRIITSLSTLMICFVFVPVAFAHPLGNFTINHYAELHVSKDSVSIDYVLDMAEIPAFQEIAAFDANGNGQADASEAAGYHAAKCATLQTDLSLRANNIPLSLVFASSNIEFPAGAGGLPTLRLTCEFHASFKNATEMVSLTFVDNSYSERIGWREIVVIADGVTLHGDFATTSISNRLTSYPQDLLVSPLDQREIALGITHDAKSSTLNPARQISSVSSNRADKFTELITLENLTLPTVLFALFISFIWGAMHAMTPGHGKTIVGAYLVGSRGTVRHALYLGLTTTITHTLGVFALGLVTLMVSHYIVPEELFPWMTMLSGLLVVGIGFKLFIERFKSSGMVTWFHTWRNARQGVQPAFLSTVSGTRIETYSQMHPQGFVLAARHEHAHDPSHHPHYHFGHDHAHENGDHSHLPPETITWRSLLALGISGGLLPCPSALVVLLGAIALDKIGFGMILVLAFSLGLAGALTAIGVLFIYAGKLFQRFPTSGKVIGVLPVVSALFVSAVGAAIVYRALVEIGIV